jgi:hypothetical protein
MVWPIDLNESIPIKPIPRNPKMPERDLAIPDGGTVDIGLERGDMIHCIRYSVSDTPVIQNH